MTAKLAETQAEAGKPAHRKIDLSALAKELDRPKKSLIALTEANDPFDIAPYRRRNAEWLAELWESTILLPYGVHVRRIHYKLTALDVYLPVDGARYKNTYNDAQLLNNAVRDAIYLGLLPGEAIVDNKNPAPINFIFGSEQAWPPRLDTAFVYRLAPYELAYEIAGELVLPVLDDLPALPTAYLSYPKFGKQYHIEIWCEKSTMNDVLVPLGRQYGVNIVTGTGELSATACRNFVDRFLASGRFSARILYVSDHDPKGNAMPVSVARKIEYELYRRGLDLDVQVRPIALTFGQCVELQLPRTPTKQTDNAAAQFEQRFGEGATELDALEALFPGRLAEILTTEIERYREDPTLTSRTYVVAKPIHEQIKRAIQENTPEFQADHDACREEFEQVREDLSALNDEYQQEIAQLTADFGKRAATLRDRAVPIFDRANNLCEAAKVSLDRRLPDIDRVEWPTPLPGDEDPDPLFDSRRDYVEQIDRYKRYQGKLTERKQRALKVFDRSTAAGRKAASQQAWRQRKRQCAPTPEAEG